MSNLLVIESATDICSVAFVQNGIVMGQNELLEPFKHSERLTLLIQDLLDGLDVAFGQLDGVGVSSGPGSYTSLRVGTSVAKGLCFGLDLPLIALETMRGIATGMKDQQADADYFIPMIDARRMEVYCKVFDNNLKPISQVEAKILEVDSFEELEQSGKVCMGGNGAAKTKSLFKGRAFSFSPVVRCSAATFATDIQNKYEKKKFENLALFEPLYLKSPAITKPKPML